MRTLAVVRPYDDRFRAQVFRFVASLGYALPHEGYVLPSGCDDDEAAAWIATLSPGPDLLLIPFHQHESRSGKLVDGVGVCLALPQSLRQPILMPMSNFSHGATFPRREQELRNARPDVFARLVALPPSRIGASDVGADLSDIATGARR